MRCAGAPVRKKAGPRFLRLANKDDIGELAKIVFADADPRPSDDGVATHTFETNQDAAHMMSLDAHPRHADDVRLTAALVIDLLDVLVDDRD